MTDEPILPRRRDDIRIPSRGVPTVIAAGRMGLGSRAFKKGVREGKIPLQPLPYGHGELWDLHAVERYMDSLSGIKEGDGVEAELLERAKHG